MRGFRTAVSVRGAGKSVETLIVSVVCIGLRDGKEELMSKRHSMGRSHSRRDFSRKARSVHPRNVLDHVGPMRGGIRL